MSDHHPCTQQEPENGPEIIQEADQSQHVLEEPETVPESDDGDKNQITNKKRHRKVKQKAKQLILSPLTKLKKFKEKKVLSEDVPPPCPYAYDEYYDGAEFATSGCFLCCFNPSASSSLDGVSVELKNPVFSSSYSSSYGNFLKSLIEKNDFYSKECNIHEDMNLSAGEA